MALYKYEALDADGKKKKGTLEANNQEQANNSLRAEGLTVTNLAEAGMFDKEISIGGSKKPSARDMSVFCRQFVGILSAGVTVIKALDMLYEQMEQPTLKKALYNVRNSVQKGESLAAAMADEPDAFPSILCNMIAAGEASGNLEVCFERMAIQFEKNARLKALVKKAMIYPIAIILVAVAVVVIMMVVVVPKFSVMFEGMGQELPLATRIVVAISNFMMNRWYVLIGFIAVLIAAWKAFSSSDFGIHFLANFALKGPLIGNLTVKSACANLARTLSTLMASGLSMVEALEITGKTMSNVLIKESLDEAIEEVTHGIPLSTPLMDAGLFPTMICQMVKIGEETGNLESMLDRVVDYYEEEVENATQALTAAMEPMIIVVLALVVGGIVAAVYSPILSMYGAVDEA